MLIALFYALIQCGASDNAIDSPSPENHFCIPDNAL